MKASLLRTLIVTCGAVAIVVIATVHLGALAGVIVFPIMLLFALSALLTNDIEGQGRSYARASELRADFARRFKLQKLAAEELERAAEYLEVFVDDGSADAEIERLKAQAFWDRKRSKH